MSRLEQAFSRIGQPRLVAYATAGDPDLARSEDVMRAIARGGADAIEVGVPFSDPVADGPAVQRASERALAAGATLETTLAMIERLRRDVTVPLVLFTYVNPVFRYGIDRFVDRAAAAGVDGVLLLDLPIEESGEVHARLEARALDQIFLVSPTTTDARLHDAARWGRGFLYAISRLGVTGARTSLSDAAAPLVQRLRAETRLPIALGFGISSPEQVRAVTSFADAAVVGSALVDHIAASSEGGRNPSAAVETFVRWLKGAGV
jgi:tryptophan synthase alpha chain